MSSIRPKFHILVLLLFLFISCGDENSGFVKKIFKKNIDSTLISKLPKKEMKTIVERKLDSVFGQLNEMGAFNGSILVAKSGKVLYKKHFGYCNKKTKTLLNDSSLFQLASVSKVITATAVMILQERGLIDLEKPVTAYLNDFPYEGVTIKNLLSHRSGLPNYVYALHSQLYIPGYKMSNQDMFDLIKEKKPRRYLRPNRRFNYSNTNYAFLALIVEKVSGKTFQEFLRSEIFEPLGMKHSTTINEIGLDDYNVTKPYDERWKNVEFDASDYVVGDKSIYSTVYDLYLLSEALYNNKILKKETQLLSCKPYSRERFATNYGFGWRMKDYRKEETKEVYHNGWWHGYRSAFHRKLSDSLTVVVLSNQLNKAAYQTHLIYQVLSTTIDLNAGLEDAYE